VTIDQAVRMLDDQTSFLPELSLKVGAFVMLLQVNDQSFKSGIVEMADTGRITPVWVCATDLPVRLST
jgi:hypothetical protein